MFDTSPFDSVKYDSTQGAIQLLQSYINSHTGISAVINVYKMFLASINGVTQVSTFVVIHKALKSTIQSSTSFLSDLIIRGKQLLNAIVSTSTSLVS
jgi:hypothetical protein